MVHKCTTGALVECEAIHMRNVGVPDRVTENVRRNDHRVACAVLVWIVPVLPSIRHVLASIKDSADPMRTLILFACARPEASDGSLLVAARR